MTIHVALAGAGAFGQKHLDAIRLIPDVKVISVVGRELDKTREVAQKYGIPHAATDLADSLKIAQLDAVILATPTQMHASQTLQCLDAGKHVQVEIPLASGECNYTRHEFRPLLAAQCLDFVQPDICVCGGLLEMKKIAAMAEAHYVRVAPHNPMGPVATAVNTHFAASTPNFFILEYHPDDEGARKDLLQEPLMVKDGYIPLPTKPGLGIELNEEAIRRYPAKRWKRGFEFRADGSVGFI